MKKEYNLKCGCGATAKFSVELSTCNQSRVDSMLLNLRVEANHWLQEHSKCHAKTN